MCVCPNGVIAGRGGQSYKNFLSYHTCDVIRDFCHQFFWHTLDFGPPNFFCNPRDRNSKFFQSFWNFGYWHINISDDEPRTNFRDPAPPGGTGGSQSQMTCNDVIFEVSRIFLIFWLWCLISMCLHNPNNFFAPSSNWRYWRLPKSNDVQWRHFRSFQNLSNFLTAMSYQHVYT